MNTIWKRFGDWVIDLRSNLFVWARIKLTAVYIGIILLVLAVYSTVLFVGLTKNIRTNADLTSLQQRHFADKTVDHIQELISLIDVAAFIVAAGGSYWLAGVTLKPIRNALEAQQVFSADASHELRTPLAVMKTDIEVLLRGQQLLPDPAKKVLQSNLEEINFMSKMTEQLLELSRGQNLNAFDIIDVTQSVTESVKKFREIAAKKQIGLKLENNEKAEIKGNKEYIKRILHNIIANAITYTNPNGLVKISSTASNNLVVIEVVDNGIGIGAKDLPHIYKRFFKADSARTVTESGSGLGLAITKQLVESQGGAISIKSKLGEGTSVYLSFPTFR